MSAHAEWTQMASQVLTDAVQFAKDRGAGFVAPCHLGLALFKDHNGLATRVARKAGAAPESVVTQLGDKARQIPAQSPAPPSPSPNQDLMRILNTMEQRRVAMEDTLVAVDHMLLCMHEAKETADILDRCGLNKSTVERVVLEMRKGKKITNKFQEQNYEALSKYATDLNQLAEDGKLDPVIGRDEEIRRTIRVLSRRTKNNPVLIGEPGVGKTAIAEGIAQRIVRGDVPESLSARIYSLDMGALIAGASYQGEFEERLKSVLNEVKENQDKVILFIDEIHLVIGAGQGKGAMDAANLLKPLLARGELRTIGATTLEEYRKYIEKDAAFERRFQPVHVNEPSVPDCVSILRGLKDRYETHHGVRIADGALVLAAQLADRYITGRFMPDKAIDLVDEACANTRVQLDSRPEQLDALERRRRQLEIEEKAMQREKDQRSKDRLTAIRGEMQRVDDELGPLLARYEAERKRVGREQELKQRLEEKKTKLARAEREGNMELAADLKYNVIPLLQDQIRSAHEEMQKEGDKIMAIKKKANETPPDQMLERPQWPILILRTPKGWTGPNSIDGKTIEGSYRSHQVPMSSPASNPSHMVHLEEWLKSYEPEHLFDNEGKLMPELKELIPPKHLRMGKNPYTNPTVTPLVLPDYASYGIDDPQRGSVMASDTTLLGTWLRDVIRHNPDTFRIFGPDETASNRLQAVYEVTNKQWMGTIHDTDDTLAQHGRVMEMLSEHQCEGWLEGYLLTGGHGLLSSYEAFIHIITSMVNQHQKWYKMCKEIDWRNDLSSLNILLASHVWRQDHNGFTHQDPGFIGHVATKRPEIVRIYLPPDANCLLSCMHHCLKSKHYINVITAGKHAAPQWLTMEEARQHCTQGISIWEWASNDKGAEPDLILAAAGDVPTLEMLAAVTILRRRLPDLKLRVINVVDLMKLCTPEEHPHGMSHAAFDSMFTTNKPVIFNFHGYVHLVEKLIFDRHNRNFVTRGYQEEGTISTPFDMTVMNHVDRFHLVMDACDLIENVAATASVHPKTRWTAAYVRQEMQQILVKHRNYINEFGVDMDEVNDWKWDL